MKETPKPPEGGFEQMNKEQGINEFLSNVQYSMLNAQYSSDYLMTTD